MYVYDGTGWIAASAASTAILTVFKYTATAGQTTFTGADDNALTLTYTAGSAIVTVNGAVMEIGTDVTASNGTSIVLAQASLVGDEVNIYAFATFNIANTYTQAEVDAFAVKLTGNQTVAGVKTFSSAPVVAGLSNSGNLTFTGTGNRITGDFSNATFANRVAFQTSTTNDNTTLTIIPNGTGSTSQVQGYASSDTTNSSRYSVAINASAALFASDRSGTGTFLPMVFNTGGSERLRIDTSGNVGIGTSSPAATAKVTIRDASIGLYRAENTVGGFATFGISPNAESVGVINCTNELRFSMGSVERMRITSGGNLVVGNTTTINDARLTVMGGGTGIVVRHSSAAGGKFWNAPYVNPSNQLYIINNANAGVTLSDGATAWAANSDLRLKDIIEPINNALEKVSSLRTVIGKYKTDDESKRRAFLIGQDVETVLPEAVTKSKLVNSEDETEYLQVAYSDIVPLLAASIKELKAIVDQQSTELDSVKAELQELKGTN
jgi:hypothetical protein